MLGIEITCNDFFYGSSTARSCAEAVDLSREGANNDPIKNFLEMLAVFKKKIDS